MTPPRHRGRHGDGCGRSHLSGAWNGNVGMELPKTIGYREKMRQVFFKLHIFSAVYIAGVNISNNTNLILNTAYYLLPGSLCEVM